MANLTVDEAIAKTRQFLDDTSAVEASQRWSDARVKDALADALSVCLVKYSDDGGDRFDLETNGTTSATDGSVSFAASLPLLIKQVCVVINSVAYRLPTKDRMRRGTADLTARSLRILYVREYQLSSTTSHPLVGVGPTEANSWRAFDKWVCLEAASSLAVKDMEEARLGILQQERERAARDAMARAATPSGYETSRPEWNPVYQDISWQLVQPSMVYLTRVRW